MTATAQCVRQQTTAESAHWTSLFDEVDISSAKSCQFMKKLIALGVSNILYWRGLLPENAFGERSVGDTSLKILRNEKNCPAAPKIISWIKASFVPIANRWLRNFYLVIRDKENSTTLETYTFRFSYGDQGDSVQTEVYRNDQKIPMLVESKTMEMLSNIAAIVKPLGPAPFPCTISIDMDFHTSMSDLDIPKDWTTDGFLPVEQLEHNFEGRRVAVNLGDINTVHHDCKVQVRTAASKLSLSQKTDTSAKSSQDPKSSQSREKESQQCQDESGTTAASNELSSDLKITCLCHITDEILDLVECNSCHDLHHLTCYGFYQNECDVDRLKEHFVCYSCSPYLQSRYMSQPDFEEITHVRLIIADWLENSDNAEDHPLLSEDMQTNLVKDKIITVNKRNGQVKVQQKMLEKVAKTLFNSSATVEDWRGNVQSSPRRDSKKYRGTPMRRASMTSHQSRETRSTAKRRRTQ